MGVRFTIGSGKNGVSRVTFDRATPHSKEWDEQKKGFRLRMGMPEHGNG
jgi:hypothetical protein